MRGRLSVACCGFYRLFFNGKEVTKGHLAPYISNPDCYVYYDVYDLTPEEGENVIGLLLGNGFQNSSGGYIWDFDKASFRSAPKVSLVLDYTDGQGSPLRLMSDESFKVSPSPIRSDDYRFGETFDARYETEGWTDKGFDDGAWRPALKAEPPKGILRPCAAEPIVTEKELAPISVTPAEGGYIYDFGECNAGVCRLSIEGKRGQTVTLTHADSLKDGDLYLEGVWFVRDFWERDRHIVHKDTYICKGEGREEYTPSFTYHGFRYVKVCGITPQQARPDLLRFIVFHSDLETRGGFTCSDPDINTLWEIGGRSDLSNFHYFPTDCPQREKNGWTADAALSCEHMLLRLGAEKSLSQWYDNIIAAQREDGALPGIVPTAGWGFRWGNGPGWDAVLTEIPYRLYLYRGDTDIIRRGGDAVEKYLRYIASRRDGKGLLRIGLGDWCHVGGIKPKAPLELTDSVMAVSIAEKAAFLFEAAGFKEKADLAVRIKNELTEAVRRELIDKKTLTAAGRCQTSQALCLYYGIFTPEERPEAFRRLLELIDEAEGRMDLGVLGGRVIFPLLSDMGRSDVALRMILGPEYPSYGNWLRRGATTLWEDFLPHSAGSMNHHFWGHISGWFLTRLAGIRLNPSGKELREVHLRPDFTPSLTYAEGYHVTPYGRISSRWERKGEDITVTVGGGEEHTVSLFLPQGYAFEDGSEARTVTSGSYRVLKKK